MAGAVVDTVVVSPASAHAGGAQFARTWRLSMEMIVIDVMMMAAAVVLAIITLPPYAWR